MYTYLFDKPTLFHILCIYLTEVSLMGHKQKTEVAERAASVALEVELEGVEPSSKQGNNTLSTCLFRTSFSCIGKTRTTNRHLIL